MSLWDPFKADPAKWAKLISSPAYITGTANYRQGVQQLFYNAGVRPSAEQLAQYGIDDPGENPYGVAQMLLKGLGSANHGTINTANAAGLEESGAAAAGLNANNEHYKAQAASNIGGLLGNVNSLTQGYTGQIGNIFDTLEQDAVPAAPNITSSQGLTPDSPIPQVYAPIGTSTPTTVHDEGPGAYAQSKATPVSKKLTQTKIKPISYAGRAL